MFSQIVIVTFTPAQAQNFTSYTFSKNPHIYSVSVLLVEFSDVKHTVSRENILNKLHDLNNYIVEASYGLYKLEFYLTEEWHALPNSMEFYDKEDTWFLLKDSIEAFDDEVNFSRYHKVMIVHAGHNEAYSGYEKDIRSHYFNVHCGTPVETLDGALISSAIIISEYDPLGAIVHEFLHMLGAIDLYGEEGERERFIGPWDPMATGHRLGVPQIIDSKYLIAGNRPPHPSSWTKIRIGWLRESDITTIKPGKHVVEILPLEDSSEGIHVVKIPITNSKYYLIEVREKRGFDSHLPDEGFLLYISDENAVNVYDGLLTLIDANSSTITLNDAPFKPGQMYIDEKHNLMIEFLKMGTKYIVKVTYKAPDLVLERMLLSVKMDSTFIEALLSNKGEIIAGQVVVYLFIDGRLYNKTILKNILPNQRIFLTYLYPNEPGPHTLLLEAQLIDDVIEYNKSNNRIITSLYLPGERKEKTQEWSSIPLPKRFGKFSLLTGDIDGDALDEVIHHDRGEAIAFIIDHNGLIIDKRGCNSISIEDFDDDGVNEIFCIWDKHAQLQSFRSNLNWTADININYPNQYKFSDINKDGIKDIVILRPLNERIIKSKYGGTLSFYEALNITIIDGRQGKFLREFTVTTKEDETFEFDYYISITSYIGDYGLIDVKDINNDENPEVIVGLISNNMSAQWYDMESYIIYVYSINGSLLWRKEFPISSYGYPVAYLVIGDFIGDKHMEILLSRFYQYGLSLINCEGEILWSLKIEGAKPALSTTSRGDIVVSSGEALLAIDPIRGNVTLYVRVPNDEEGGIIDLTVIPHLHVIFFTTDKSFYLLNENGEILCRHFFGTYSWPVPDFTDNSIIIRIYESRDLWKVNLQDCKISKLFSATTYPSSIIELANLDDDSESEYILLTSFIEAYDSNGSLMWSFGLNNFVSGNPLDLDDDGYYDAIFIETDFLENLLLYKNGRVIYKLQDCSDEDLNGDNFKELICTSYRGLEIYDVDGNLIWNVTGSDFRLVDTGQIENEKIIAVSIGIFSEKPPQVRLYSSSGKLIKVIGYYWDPPYVQILSSDATRRTYLLVIGPRGRGEYHLEVYDISTGRLIFDKLIPYDVWDRCYERRERAELIDINNDGKEEIVLPPFVFTLNGEILSNNYPLKEEEQHILISDINGDGEKEYIEVSYSKRSIIILDNKKWPITEIPLQDFKEIRGLIITESKPGEIAGLIAVLTDRGYYLVPIKWYYVAIVSPYGGVVGSGWYKSGEEALIIANDTLELGNGTRRIFLSWTGDINATTNKLILKVNSSMILVANWKTQYYLTVKSEYGNPQGEGWYDENSVATFSITPIVEDFLIRQVFISWSGDSIATSPTATILMDGPKTVIANWRRDYTKLYIIILAVIILIGVTLLILSRLKKKVRNKTL